MVKHPALFLDRDGTIIEKVPYLNDPDQVKLKPEMVTLMRRYADAGYLLVVITNQSGIARGLISAQQYARVNARLLELLKHEKIDLHGVFMCASHPDANDPRRKPSPGMLLEAAKAHGIDLAKSLMVGDDPVDVAAGKRAGVKHALFVPEFLEKDWLNE